MENKIINKIKELPWHKKRTWAVRYLGDIDKIIVHQELAEGTVEQVNNYHISIGNQNHLSPKGAPHFAYHFGIEKDGTIIQANELTHKTWHTRGKNTNGLAIMLVGNFDGEGHKGNGGPEECQLKSLEFLLDTLITILPRLGRINVFGHSDFGKPACPGYATTKFIEEYRNG